MHEPLNEDRNAAAGGSRTANHLNGAQVAHDALFDPLEDMTAAAARAAKDYRSWMLENMKINMSAALGYANGLASMSARGADPDTPERQTQAHPQCADTTTTAAVKVADEYRAKAFELMTANMRTTLEYAQRLVNVKTPAEFVELSASHARKQFELIMKQTADVGSLAQKMATPNVGSLFAGFAKALGERKE